MSSEKDKEIKALQDKLSKYENHSSSSKNDGRPLTNRPPNQTLPAPKPPNNTEILDFIQVTMATLESYKQALTN